MNRFIIIGMALATLAAACSGSDEPCPLEASGKSNTPIIESAQVLDGDARQALLEQQEWGDDPWLIILTLDFSDSDGDLGWGNVLLYSENELVFSTDSGSLFRQRGIPLSAQSGTLIVAVRVASQPTDLAGSMYLPLSLVLQDQQGHVSQCRHLDLTIRYQRTE